MYKLKICFAVSLTLLLIFPSKGFSQKDSSIQMTQVRISYAMQFPKMDMAKEFGWNSNLTGGVEFKFKSDWALGLRGSFLFGSNVNNDSIFRYFKEPDGSIIDDQGDGNMVIKRERGYNLFVFGERLFNVLAPNKNSGFVLNLGLGYMMHKIHFDWRDGKIYQLKNNLEKGYDRLSMGWAGAGFVGYTYLSNSRLVNFFAGFTYTLALTHNVRGFNYDTRSYDTGTHTDILYGFRAGWILPLYKRSPDEYYYK